MILLVPFGLTTPVSLPFGAYPPGVAPGLVPAPGRVVAGSVAGSAAADWALESLGCESLISIIDPNNNASKAVAMRLGEQYDHNEFVKGRDCEIFKMTKTDFYQRKA